MKNPQKIAALGLCILLALAAFPTFLFVRAENKATSHPEEKVVRVGWYESLFNLTDQYGRRSGYAYEYQMKISAYTGWTYEYVTGSWPELYQMLLDGKIDLLSDVSMTPEREEQMLFASLPMGSEVYYACVSSKQDTGITVEDFSTFNGKRIGVNQGSLQEALLQDWLESNGIEAEVVELSVTQPEELAMLNGGEIDAFVDVDMYGVGEGTVPVCMIGSSDVYFAVTPERSDLLGELNVAMERIREEDRNYNYRLLDKYFHSNIVNLYLTQNEINWLASHGSVRVGYLDNFLAFCGQDEQTGELTGALKDYLKQASVCMQNAVIDFEATPYATMEDAINALKADEIDCLFPINLTAYDGEEQGLLTTKSLMETEVYAAVRPSERHRFTPDSDLTVALVETNCNDRTFVMEYFPNWTPAYHATADDCMQAVADGAADCALVCNYQLGKQDHALEQHGLSAVTTGRDMDFSFAVRSRDDYLYAIMNKIEHYVPESAVNSALVSYSYDEKTVTFVEYLQAHIAQVMTVLGVILAIFLFLMLKSSYSEAKAKASLRALEESLGREEKQKKELDITKDKAYTDPLTGVKSKNAYVEACATLQNSIANGKKPEFAVVVFDVNDLKHMNDVYGHEAGDRHILAAKKLICDAFKRSPVYRIGGDEFVVILTGEDYQNGASLVHSFDRQIDSNLSSGLTVVSSGYAQFDLDGDMSYSDVFQRADHQMYQRKRYLKGTGAKPASPAVQTSRIPAAQPVAEKPEALQPQAVFRRDVPPQATPSAFSAPSANTTEQAFTSGDGEITIECGGVQIRAKDGVATEKLSALIGTLRSR